MSSLFNAEYSFWLGLGGFFIALAGLYYRRAAALKKPSNSPASTNTNTQSVYVNVGDAAKSAQPSQNKESAILPEPRQMAKADVRILFIDDDTSFKVVKILRQDGWINTKIKADIKSLDESDVLEADVLFIDIQGVGKALGFSDEGLGLVSALLQKHPLKKIVIYSSEQTGDRFHIALRRAHAVLPKTADPYLFITTIEQVLSGN